MTKAYILYKIGPKWTSVFVERDGYPLYIGNLLLLKGSPFPIPPDNLGSITKRHNISLRKLLKKMQHIDYIYIWRKGEWWYRWFNESFKKLEHQ